MRIVHISDIHFGSSHSKGIDAKPAASGLSQHFESSPTKYVCDALEKLNPKPDLIFLSGDYITGADKKKDYSDTKDFLSKIANRSGLYLNKSSALDFVDRVLMVPGNHDVDREEREPLKNFKDAFSDYLTPYSMINSTSKIRRFAPLYVFEDLKLVVYCLSTVELSSEKDELIENTISFLDSECKKKFASDVSKIDVLTSELKERLYFSAPAVKESQIDQFINCDDEFQSHYSDSENFLKIVLCHHPFNTPLLPVTEISPYGSILNGAEFIGVARSRGYQITAHGHIHEQSYEIQKGFKKEFKNMIHIGTPSLSKDGVINGLTTIDLKDSGPYDSIQITFRKYDKIKRIFSQEGESLNINLQFSDDATNIEASGASMSVLLDKEIKDLVSRNRIIIDGDIDLVEAASYDCALGYKYKQDEKTFELESNENGEPAQIILKPGKTVHVCTKEIFNLPKNMIFHASVMSKWMKMGLIAGISTFVDPGFKGKFYFPLTNISNTEISIKANEPIMSIEIVRVNREVDKGWVERHGKERQDF